MHKEIEIGDSCRVRSRPETWLVQGFSFGGRVRLSRRDGAEVMLVDTDDVRRVASRTIRQTRRELPAKRDGRQQAHRELLPRLNTKAISLLDEKRSLGQLASLERRTGRAGRDIVDHPRGAHDDLSNVIAGVSQLLESEHTTMGGIRDWILPDRRRRDYLDRSSARQGECLVCRQRTERMYPDGQPQSWLRCVAPIMSLSGRYRGQSGKHILDLSLTAFMRSFELLQRNRP